MMAHRGPIKVLKQANAASQVCICISYTIVEAMFEWDWNNVRKIRAHGIKREEAEQALLNDPISMYEQDVDGEIRSCITARRTLVDYSQ